MIRQSLKEKRKLTVKNIHDVNTSGLIHGDYVEDEKGNNYIYTNGKLEEFFTMPKIDGVNYNGDGTLTVEIDGVSHIIDTTNLWDDTDTKIEMSYDYEKIFDEMLKRFNQKPIIEHKCHNCGATLEIDSDMHIFNCPYCHSCYAIGTERIHEVI